MGVGGGAVCAGGLSPGAGSFVEPRVYPRPVPTPPDWNHAAFVRGALPPYLAGFVVLILVYPNLRAWRRTGAVGWVAGGDRRGGHRAVGLAKLLWNLGVLAWVGLCLRRPLPALGVTPISPLVAAGSAAVAVSGAILISVSQSQMGASWRMGMPAGGIPLVQTGVFAWVRHPIYLGLFAQALALFLVTPAPASLGLLVTGAGIVRWQAVLEERYLEGHLGEDYRVYARRVGRFWPRPARR